MSDPRYAGFNHRSLMYVDKSNFPSQMISSLQLIKGDIDKLLFWQLGVFEHDLTSFCFSDLKHQSKMSYLGLYLPFPLPL